MVASADRPGTSSFYAFDPAVRRSVPRNAARRVLAPRSTVAAARASFAQPSRCGHRFHVRGLYDARRRSGRDGHARRRKRAHRVRPLPAARQSSRVCFRALHAVSQQSRFRPIVCGWAIRGSSRTCMTVIPNPCPRCKPIGGYRREGGRKRLLAVGNLRAEKGHSVLVEAFSRIAASSSRLGHADRRRGSAQGRPGAGDRKPGPERPGGISATSSLTSRPNMPRRTCS